MFLCCSVTTVAGAACDVCWQGFMAHVVLSWPAGLASGFLVFMHMLCIVSGPIFSFFLLFLLCYVKRVAGAVYYIC